MTRSLDNQLTANQLFIIKKFKSEFKHHKLMKKFTKASQLAQIIMRTSLIVSFISFLLLSLVQASEVKGQQGLDQQINIHLKNVSFNVFLKEIEQKTAVSFLFSVREIAWV